MLVKEFFVKYNGKGIDYDGYYSTQCVDLYRQYVKECLGYPQSKPVVGAKDIWNTYLKDYYKRISNTPDGIPQLGDIVIWNKNAGGGFGHVCIYSFGDINSFVSLDQNWPLGSLCHFQNHSYKNVSGWLRPNKFIKEHPAEPIINDQTKIDLGGLGIMEVQKIKSTIKDLRRDLKTCQQKLSELSGGGDEQETYIPIGQLSSLLYSLAKAIDRVERGNAK